MSKRNVLIAITAALAWLPITASAQPPTGGSYGPYAPNYYNRNTQPLSPYLNLLRGGNPAVNYFYGVRPGLQNGPLASPLSVGAGTQGRQTFFPPQIDTLYELEDTKPSDGIRPTGHPFGFSNNMGYFGAGAGTGRGNQPQNNTARRTMGR
jgi:hypothetical protein